MSVLFENRGDAGRRLAERLRAIPFKDPLVLGIPRGGVEVGAPLARALGAELEVVLSRKLRAPDQPELAIGAVSESGVVYLNSHGHALGEAGAAYVEHERRKQIAEIEHRRARFRTTRTRAPVANRSVIVTDDGIATGSTMIAALHTLRAEGAAEITVAVPVAPRDRLAQIAELSDRVACLHVPDVFQAIGPFYRDFDQVPDDRVADLLEQSGRRAPDPSKPDRGATGGGTNA